MKEKIEEILNSCNIGYGVIEVGQAAEKLLKLFETNQPKAVPYQRCPICDGTGKVPSYGFTSSLYFTCDKCNGQKIIPMKQI